MHSFSLKEFIFAAIGRATLSGGGFIIEFDKVEPMCFGKSFRPLVVS
jgi:hypothetical protein